MKSPAFLLVSLSAISLCSACASPELTPIVVTEGLPVSIEKTIWIDGDENSCRVSYSPSGPWVQDVAGLVDFDADTQFALSVSDGVPWRCVAGTIYELQENGAAYVGFVSNPKEPG